LKIFRAGVAVKYSCNFSQKIAPRKFLKFFLSRDRWGTFQNEFSNENYDLLTGMLFSILNRDRETPVFYSSYYNN